MDMNEKNIESDDPKREMPCFIVAIGSSAGGQEALEQILTAMPSDCAASFVIVMHLPSAGPSFLPEMLSRYTTMEVVTAEEAMPLAPNRVHVIPPGKNLTVGNGLFHLENLELSQAHHTIDGVFRSLACEAGKHVIAVVLSGYGKDGLAGAQAVKEAGGIVIAEDPSSALNPLMPQNVIDAGTADFILPPEEIAGKISDIARGSCSLPDQSCTVTELDDDLHEIFTIVKSATGHDFSSYKRATVIRRLERRMAINETGGMRKYIHLLRESETEAQALSQEILIGVTSFFRDPEAFHRLEHEVIPQLVAGRNLNEPIRVWHACCSTGEEVYSTAILIREYLTRQHLDVPVQLFATDIDETAIAQARAGIYPDEIEEELGEERLRTWFTRVDGRWRVSKKLREMVVFAHHSVIKDPPFSRLDLLVCRNFLIYLNPDMQKRLFSLFHQVLKPGGFLFLGSSETVGRHSDLFAAIDKKWKIFKRLDSTRSSNTMFPFAASVRRFATATRNPRTPVSSTPAPVTAAEKLIMEQYSPPFVVVNEKYEVTYVSNRTNPFLQVPVGEPTRDILRMAREELRPALRAGIYKSFYEQRQMSFRGGVAASEGELSVNVIVEPLPADPSEEKLAVVVFESITPAPSLPAHGGNGGKCAAGDEISKDILIRQLEEQLRITHEQLQATAEQLETSNEGFMSANEELMSMNEEFQSANEELQSTNEELETSREELQALNEELSTVNSELQGKVEELNEAGSDMENLLTSSEIAILFLDRNFAIKRFSPAMGAIFNLIPSDIGRPFRHFAGTIDWPGLAQDAQTVLEKLSKVEREVGGVANGHSYLMRILPYRSTDDRIDGIVVTLIDITELKQAGEALRKSEEKLKLFIEHAPASLAMFDRDMRYVSVSRRWASDYGLTDRNLSGMSHYEIFPEITEEWREIHRRGLEGEVLRSDADRFVRIDGSVQWIRWEVRPWYDAGSEIGGIVIFTEDITHIKEAEDILHRYELLARNSRDIILFIRRDDGQILEANAAAIAAYGYAREELLSLTVKDLRTPESLILTDDQMTAADSGGILFETVHRRKDGFTFPAEVSSQGATIGGVRTLISVIRDITERKRGEEQVRRHMQELETINDELSRFNNASVGRELRMIELKREVNAACMKAGEYPPYSLDFTEEQF